MSIKVKRIGVLTSGGDAPGMNAAVRSVVNSAHYLGIEVIGIRRGWQGLINGDVLKMDGKHSAHIIDKGGTALFTARCDEFRTHEGREKAYATCKLLGLDGIVAIGGDGTFAGCLALAQEFPISVVGIPATIDNDIGCTHYSIGFDTAANTAIEAIDKLRDTMSSHERCSVIEVMGHRAGNLAQYVGIATGATAVLVPEKCYNFCEDVAEKIRDAKLNNRSHFMIVVAEGARCCECEDCEDSDEKSNDTRSAGQIVADEIRSEMGLDPRVTVLGHVQRGGSPNARDRVTATRMGYFAVAALAQGKSNRIIVHENDHIKDIDMEEGLKQENQLNPEEMLVLRAMIDPPITQKRQ